MLTTMERRILCLFAYSPGFQRAPHAEEVVAQLRERSVDTLLQPQPSPPGIAGRHKTLPKGDIFPDSYRIWCCQFLNF